MATFIVAFVLLLLTVIAMSVGVLLGRPAIKGSCGGLNHLGLEGSCGGQCSVAKQAECAAQRSSQSDARG